MQNGFRSKATWLESAARIAAAAGALALAAVGCSRPQDGGRATEAARADQTAETSPTDAVEGPAIVLQGELATVLVERRLYERPGEEHFLIHVRVENPTDKPVGVDVRDYWTVVYPNQWGALTGPVRTEINERRMPSRALDEQGCGVLRRAFEAGGLAVAPPGGAVDYYREFNASGRADVEAQTTERYAYVSLAGQTLLTDGARCENLTLDWGSDDTIANGDLILTAPVAWGTVPEGSIVVDSGARAPLDVPARTNLAMDLPSPADPRWLTVTIETGEGEWRMTGCESAVAGGGACDRPSLVVLDEEERRAFGDLIAGIQGMPRCEPFAHGPNCFTVRLALDDDLRNTCLPFEWFPRGEDRGPLAGSDPCLAELRLAWWIYETFDRHARADTTPQCSPACCAPDDRTPDPTGAVECCFCEE